MATAPSIASILGEAVPEARSLPSLSTTWIPSVPTPTGAESATQVHLSALQKTRPLTPHAELASPAEEEEATAVTPPERGGARRPVRRHLQPADRTQFALPAQIGPYRVGRSLARGGMSQVVEAWDLDRRCAVALKVMKASVPGRRAEREAWDREISILGAMQHPGVVPLLDYGIGEGGELYLAMPLLQGRSARGELVSMRRAGPAALMAMTYDVLLPVFLQLCDTLQYVHSMGVLHCDLKPGNIFLPRNGGMAKGLLLDWGVSVVRSIARGEGGRPGGTPGYMAPEQITGRVGDLDERTDVYGLGCLLYEFVAWRPAVRRGEPRRALRDALAGNITVPHLQQTGVAIPDALSDIVMKALSIRPSERFGSTAEMAGATRDLLGL